MRKLNLLFVGSFFTIIILGFIMDVNLLPISNQKIKNNEEDRGIDFGDNNEDYVLESLPKISALKGWTFMVYLDADNNLEEAAIDDLNEMEMVGSDSNINIIVQIDRIPSYDSSNGDWTGARRYYIGKDISPYTINSLLVQDLGEVNMGSPNTLQNFIGWGKLNYPAQKYALILWDHGSGIMYGNYPGGVCWDNTNGDDYLPLSEIDSVLSDPDYSIDLLGFDACLMGSVEAHYQLKDDVDVIVGSEELEPGEGYPYNEILLYLKGNPTATPQQLGQQIVITYDNYFPWYFDITQAAANAFTTEFTLSLQNFINVLNDTVASQKGNIQDAREASLEFDDPSYIDLYDFAFQIQTFCTGDIGTTAQYLMDNITNTIIEERHSSSNFGAHGLSIYFPEMAYSYSSNYEDNDFSSDLEWDEFLLNYYIGSSTTGLDDIYEENDEFSQATLLPQGSYYDLILNGSEYDIYSVFFASGTLIEVYILFDHDEGDLDLYLYYTDPNSVNYSESYTDNEYVSYLAPGSGYYTILVNSYTNDTYQPYDLIIGSNIDDLFEENDNWLAAKNINTNTQYTNLICRDSDYFYFWADEGYLINIQIEFSYIQGDLDLYLWDYLDETMLDSSTGATNNENIVFTANESGYFEFEVYNYEDNMNYSLFVEAISIDDIYEDNDDPWEAPLLEYGTYMDLVCIDLDCYNISLTENTWINITIYFDHEAGDLDLYLLYPNSSFATWSFSYTDNETIFFQVLFSEVYTVWVEHYDFQNMNYTLAIHETTLIWDDNFEDNDYYDMAYPVSVGDTYTDLTAIDWDFYLVFLQANVTINIYLEYNWSNGDLDLLLYNSTEDLVSWSASYNNSEFIEYTPQVSDETYILVYNTENNMYYDLSIEKVGGDFNISGPSLYFLIIIIGGVSVISLYQKKKKSTRNNS